MPLQAPTRLVLKDVPPQVQGLALRMYDSCSKEERKVLRRQLLTLRRELLDAEIGTSKIVDPLLAHFVIKAKRIYDKEHGQSYCH